MGAMDYKALAAMPVGSIVQAPFALTDPNWVPCLGQRVNRSQYPALAAQVPGVGVFTATNRALGMASTAASGAIANNGTVWALSGAIGTGNIQTTPDGITYTARTTATGSDIRSILYDGTNFVAVSGASSAVNPQYSSGGTTWTVSASSATTQTNNDQTCMTWAPTLGTVGRFCFTSGSGGASVYTSDDRGVTWTTRTAVGVPWHVAWTGQRFLLTCSSSLGYNIGVSTDGITWSTLSVPFVASATGSAGCIVSDGNGRVVCMVGSTVWASLDHGATWFSRSFPTASLSVISNGTPSYANGRFMFNWTGVGLVVSTDLLTWSVSNDPSLVDNQFNAISYKSGVYLSAGAGGTNAFSFTEDTSKFYLPSAYQGSAGGWSNFMPWIKVR